MGKDDSDQRRARSATLLDRISERTFGHYLDKWRQRIHTHPATGLPLSPLRPWIYDPRRASIEKLVFSTGRGLRLGLQLFAPLMLVVVGVSFIWDYQGVIRSCAIAGIIGFSTNWVAVQMLFRPRQSRPIFGQGLIPSQREEIINKVTNEVCEKLINEEIIRREIDDSRLISRLTEETVKEVRRIVHDPEFIRDTKALIVAYATKFSRSEGFREEMVAEVNGRVERALGRPFAAWLVGGLRGVWKEPVARLVDSELETLPDTLDRLIGEVDGALDHLPGYLDEQRLVIDRALTRIMMALVREMDVRSIVLKQLSTVTSEQLEVGFREFADDKLSYITLLGGLLGIAGGFLIVWPVTSTLVIAAGALLLALVDVLVYRFFGWARRGAPEVSCPKQ